MRPAEMAAPVAVSAVVLTVLLGGGFYPLPRVIVGAAFIAAWGIAAAGVSGRVDRTEGFLGATIAWAVFAAVWVNSSSLASKETVTTWITAALLLGICRRGGEESRRCAMLILLGGSTLVAAAVLVEAVSAGLRVGGLLENPNVAAALLAPMLPVGWSALERWSRWRWMWSVLVVAGIACTGSRAGLLALVAAVAFLLPAGRFRWTGVVTGSAAAIAVVAWRFASQPDVLAWHRTAIWQAVLRIWWGRPVIGVGPGGLVDAASVERILHPEEVGHYQFVIAYAESTPLAILVQLGAVGLLLAMMTFGSWWLSTRRDSASRAGWTTPTMASMAVFGLFHDLLTIDPVLWWWAALAGLAMAPVTGSTESAPAVDSRVRRAVVALMLMWVTAWGMISPALSRHVWFGAEASTEHVVRTLRIEPWLSLAPAGRVRGLMDSPSIWSWNQAAEALAWANTAVRVHPGRASLWADLGRVHLRIITDLGGTVHDAERAHHAFDRACRLDPHLPWHWLERARLARVLGDGDEAIRLTRRALASEPNTVRGWLGLSRLELEQGRVEAARAALTKAEELRELRTRPGLSAYDHELLEAPGDAFCKLRRELDSRNRPDE